MGTQRLSYQWRLDGVALSDGEHFSGSRQSVLQVKSALYTHGGNYDVLVRTQGSLTTRTSQVATLTIEPGSEWLLRSTNGPQSRFGHAMAYDSVRRVITLFGGGTNSPGGAMVPLNDLWEWDGTRWAVRIDHVRTKGWTNVAGAGWVVANYERPVARAHHAMCFDSNRGRLIVFGGETRAPDGTQVFLNDLWEWDGVQWFFLSTNGPAARFFGSMAYDIHRKRAVLFGGWPVPVGNQARGHDVVWEWDGEEWHRNTSAVRPNTAEFLIGGRMTYDSYRRVTVFGPAINDGPWTFWEWDGTKWGKSPATNAPNLNATVDGAFAFNGNLRRAVWFGGQHATLQNQTALYDGQNWRLSGVGTQPAPRMNTAMAYDSARQVLVMFGGDVDASRTSPGTNDTWELVSADRPIINQQPAGQFQRSGGVATFTVKATGPGILSYRWFRFRPDSPPTPLPTLGDTLTISALKPEDAGEYRVVVSNFCGETLSEPALLTLDPTLQIFPDRARASLLWSPELRPFLEAAETVDGPWSIVANPSTPFEFGMFGSQRFFRLRRVP